MNELMQGQSFRGRREVATSTRTGRLAARKDVDTAGILNEMALSDVETFILEPQQNQVFHSVIVVLLVLLAIAVLVPIVIQFTIIVIEYSTALEVIQAPDPSVTTEIQTYMDLKKAASDLALQRLATVLQSALTALSTILLGALAYLFGQRK